MTSAFEPVSVSLSDDLLRTKLTPPRLHAALLSRPALLSRLDEGLTRKLTVISGPAGSGKTTLAVDWLSRRNAPAAWVALDPGDNDAIRFLRYVLTACRAFEPSMGVSGLAALRTAQQPSIDVVLTSFVNDLSRLPEADYVLVLEDFHAITARDVHQALGFLLDHLPPNVHVLMMTRSEPPLPLARLRIQDELVELTGDDLRFSTDEARAFLEQALPVALPPEVVAQLEARTEGWAAGLRLVALALQNRADAASAGQFLTTFSGEHRHVLEYLVSEVLAAQPEPVQVFLLETSFLSRLSGPLCDVATGRQGSAAMLDALERANLFLVPLGSANGAVWYRYHTLFAEAMRYHAARQLGEGGVPLLHERASAWYEARGMLNDAVDEAIAARQFARVAALIERIVDMRGVNELYTLMSWLRQLPTDEIERHPGLCFLFGFGLMFGSPAVAASSAREIDLWIGRAEAGWQNEEDRPLLGRVYALRAGQAWGQGDFARATVSARRSLELLAPHDVEWRGISLISLGFHALFSGQVDAAEPVFLEARALCEAAQNIFTQLVALQYLGQTYYRQAALDQAAFIYQQMLAVAVGGSPFDDDRSAALDGLSQVSYDRDDLETAQAQAQEALRLSQGRGDEVRQISPSLMLARIALARGRTGEARERMQAARLRPVAAYILREVQALSALAALRAEDFAAVERWTSSLAPAPADGQPIAPNDLWALPSHESDEVTGLQHELEALILARLCIAQGNPRAALDLLEPWLADARAQGRLRGVLEILCVEALAYAALGDAETAARMLTEALTLGQPRGSRRVFLDEGRPMAALLRAVAPTIQRAPMSAYVAGLLRSLSLPDASPSSAVLSESLSPQELRVLRLIAAGLSNPEIADELVVSNNTVKTHVKNIYRKLNVSSRDDAHDVARELNLL